MCLRSLLEAGFAKKKQLYTRHFRYGSCYGYPVGVSLRAV
jgi:hypothetical protein